MDFEDSRFDSVRTMKLNAGRRRTYFFDVRKTKSDDFYITITESTKKFKGEGFERHKIFLYKEDFTRFHEKLGEAIDHIKTELLPDFDYDHYAKKAEEWENSHTEEDSHTEENSLSEEKSKEDEDINW